MDRIKAAGGAYECAGEVISFTTQENCVTDELNTIFHRGPMLSTRNTLIGMSFVNLGSNSYGICVFEPGFKTDHRLPPPGWVATYPVDKQSGVPAAMPLGEAPDPAPEIPDELKGSPVSIYFYSDLDRVDMFTLAVADTNFNIPTKLILKADFPTHTPGSEAHTLPKQPLSKSTIYRAHFKGTLASGTRIEREWTFSTK